jgi:hypothetical protein
MIVGRVEMQPPPAQVSETQVLGVRTISQSSTIVQVLHPDDVDLESQFEVVPYDDAAWDDDDDHITPADAVLHYQRTQVLKFFELHQDEPFEADAPDACHATGDAYWAQMEADGIKRLPPIRGGAIDEPPVLEQPYHPTEADWQEYRSWAETVDRLDAFNAVRDDA